MNITLPVAQTHARNSRIFERHADDWYVEPAWVWTRLFERLNLRPGMRMHDPACGRGTAVQAAFEAGFDAFGSDIVDRWSGESLYPNRYCIADYAETLRNNEADLIVSNPPFNRARAFAEAAIPSARMTCLLLPATWACGDAKARWLAKTPLAYLLFLTPRPTMIPGLGLLPGQTFGGGTKDYAIFVWIRGGGNNGIVGWLHRDGVASSLAEQAR